MQIIKHNFWIYALVFGFFLSAILIAQTVRSTPQNKNLVTTIVIDAGHGGKDPGASGSISNEKDITLQVALKLGTLINKKYPHKKIIYTRTSDDFPSLKNRHEIANAGKGDLFISIHVNSTKGGYSKVKTGVKKVVSDMGDTSYIDTYKNVWGKSTNRSGTETYVLGLHRNDQKESAIAENSDEMVDENGMLDPNSPMTNIVVAQYSQAYLNKSIVLGSLIESEFAKQGRRSDGVKQKGLEVLAGSAMPGVLVEIGFINNPQEEVYLTSDSGQWEVAQSLLNGISNYISSQENKFR